MGEMVIIYINNIAIIQLKRMHFKTFLANKL